MKKTMLAVVMSTVIAVMGAGVSCYAEEQSTQNQAEIPNMWGPYLYNNAEANNIFLRTDELFPGAIMTESGETFYAYVSMAVDAYGVAFQISVDGQSALLVNESAAILVTQSSCLEGEYTAYCEDMYRLRLDTDGSDFILQDMRMLTGETTVQIANPAPDVQLMVVYLPHNANFRDLYDEMNGNWTYTPDVSAVPQAGTDSADTGSDATTDSPSDFQQLMAYYEQICEKYVAQLENIDLDNGGISDFVHGYVGISKLEEAYSYLQNVDVNSLSESDRAAYEQTKNIYDLYIAGGILKIGGSILDELFG